MNKAPVTQMTPLKGQPVFIMRRGCFPSSDTIKELMALHPGFTLNVEANHVPYTTFVVTITKRCH